MLKILLELARAGNVTQKPLFPDLPQYCRGLPKVTDAPCSGCGACEERCPTKAVAVGPSGDVSVDRGMCIACGACTSACESGTIAVDRSTRVAVRRRSDLVMRADASPVEAHAGRKLFSRSLHVREVSTGDNASDLEAAALNNPVFDASRFGVHFVASPRHADALLVTGPVGLAMQVPLRRCHEAMSEPRLVIAAGACAISGGLHAGGYAQANGVDAILPVDVYVPGNPPHPWYLLHGLVLASQS